MRPARELHLLRALAQRPALLMPGSDRRVVARADRWSLLLALLLGLAAALVSGAQATERPCRCKQRPAMRTIRSLLWGLAMGPMPGRSQPNGRAACG
jgi:hypothetical protein